MEGGLTLNGFIHVVRRRKYLIMLEIMLVPLVAAAFSLSQPKLYQASARVLLSQQNLANQLSGVSGGSAASQQPDRIARTQAGVARTTAVTERVLGKVPGSGLTPGGLLAESDVSPNPNADVLIFSVTHGNRDMAAALVNEYAAQYTAYRRELDIAPILLARAHIKETLQKLETKGNTTLRDELVNRDQTLATMEALQTSNASVIQTAHGAAKIQPRTKRNVMLAAVLGLFLGVALAYLWETLDTRLRSTDDIGKLLGDPPLLARIPSPKKNLEPKRRLVMMTDPDGVQAEPFRMLRTNLEFVMLDSDIRTIMITSAVAREGKSTTISNLALTLARSGKRVALVDLDLRSPALSTFFSLSGPGITQVALGAVSLDEALVRIPIPEALTRSGTRRLPEYGGVSLWVLPSGPTPPDLGMFLDSQALNSVLHNLRQQFDLVLIDAPPALPVGDAMTFSRRVDGILLVTRRNVVRRPMLQELERMLAMSPARVLGFVVTDAAKEVGGYGYGYGYGTPYGSTNVDAPDEPESSVSIGRIA